MKKGRGMMEISPFSLRPRRSLSARSAAGLRRGFLLRHEGGYGCVQPWPELGDPTPEECLADLWSGRPNRLVERALACARADGGARGDGRSLLAEVEIPESHASLSVLDTGAVSAAAAAGFGVLKVKVGRDWSRERERLTEFMRDFPELRWRLDFNEWGEPVALRDWALGLGAGERARIDFLEDPFPYEPDVWARFAEETGLALALDREVGREAGGADLVVLKPAVAPTAELAERAWERGLRVVVTSYLDHPLGQLFATWEAGVLAGRGHVEVCGLQSQDAYEETDFSYVLGRARPQFEVPAGAGLGCGDLLKKLTWEVLDD